MDKIHDLKTYDNMHKCHQNFDFDLAQHQRLYEQNLLLITRVWERTFNYAMQFLEIKPCQSHWND